jgi:anti-sigma B factor antagonist
MSVMEFKASVTCAPTLAVVITVEGEIDMGSAPTLSELLNGALEVDRPSVVIDMSGVTFIDSQGVRSLLIAEHRARQAGILLVLRSPSKRVRDLLMLLGVDSMFYVDPPVSMFHEREVRGPISNQRGRFTP